MTAEEVLQRSKEQSEELGKTYGRLQTALLTPLVKRFFNIIEKPDGPLGKRPGTVFMCALPKESWFRRMMKKWRKPRIPSHPELVMCAYQDKIMIADNRKRELLCVTHSVIDNDWRVEVVAKF